MSPIIRLSWLKDNANISICRDNAVMRFPLRHFLASAICAVLFISLTRAEVIAVPYKAPEAASGAEPTLTFLWPSPNPKATLVFIPGGDGHLGLTIDRKGMGGFYGATLKPLSDKTLTSGSFHVVVFDSPVSLPVGTSYPTSRTSAEHLRRIDAVVQYYKKIFDLPVWIMGHSNGAASITEYYKMLQKEGRSDLVTGAVYSSARHGSTFNDKTNLPVLFLAHERDGCSKSTPYQSKVVFDALSRSNTQRQEYVLIRGGEGQAADSCQSGFHMFYGSAQEAYSAIDKFVFGQ
jgi:pimeloyl-ACP methyl ester carboxylesterase